MTRNTYPYRPNLRLDQHEEALTEDGKTIQEETDDCMRMLSYAVAFTICVIGGVIYWWVLS